MIWCGPSATVLFFSVNRVARQPHFFRRAALAAFRVSAVFEFYVNLYVFPFLFELVLQPVVTVLALSRLISRDGRVRVAVTWFLSIIGLVVIGFATINLIRNWHQIDWADTLRRLVLPVWLTLGVLPCLYGISLVFNYQQAFRLIRWASQDPAAVTRAQLALIAELHLRSHLVGCFAVPWPNRLTEASSLREARRVVREYRLSMHGGS